MPLTENQKQSLRKRAAKRSLEVEHLLHVAVIGDASDAAFLKSLAAECDWPNSADVNGVHVVPLGTWNKAVCCYLEKGYPGLVQLAKKSDSRLFSLAILRELKTVESISALIEIAGKVIERPAANRELASRIASVFNFILSFDGAPAISRKVETHIRQFLHRLLAEPLNDAEKASVVCALRGVGDEESIELIRALPPFREAWSGTEKVACKQIKSRIRKRKSLR
jgi:hypothetical protein